MYIVYLIYLLFATYFWWKVSIHFHFCIIQILVHFIERETLFFSFNLALLLHSIYLNCYGLSLVSCLHYHIHRLECSFISSFRSIQFQFQCIFFFVSIIFFFFIFPFCFEFLFKYKFR